MGKYPSSKLHDWFSDWHWQTCARGSTLTDIDRLWVEVRNGEPVAVFDLKDINNQKEEETFTTRVAHEWFEKHGIPTYLVYIDRDIPLFMVLGMQDNQRTFTETEMIDWIDRGLPREAMKE